MSARNFADDVVSYLHFKEAIDALSGLKLPEHAPAKSRYITAFGGKFTDTGQVSKFRATRKLIRRASDAGIVLSEIDRHFALDPLRLRSVLKAAKVGPRTAPR
jgi:hypothetical protein